MQRRFVSALAVKLPIQFIAALALTAAFGFSTPARAQSPPGRELQVTVASGMGTAVTPVGWLLNLQAQVINSQVPGDEPVAITLSAPGLMAQPAMTWRSWNGGLNAAVGDGVSATPGVYTVTGTASFADLFDIYEGPNWLTDSWLDILTPLGGPMESTVTAQATVVGLSGVTANATEVAIGDTVNFEATMTPIDAFEWVWWGFAPMTFWIPSGKYYSRTMNGSGRDANGVVAVTATCGNSVITVPITVYQVTGVTASSALVAQGDPLTFTATIDPPGGNPPAIEWFVGDVSQGNFPGNTFSPSALPPGTYNIFAKMGTSISGTSVTVVGIREVTINGPDYSGTVGSGSTFYVYQGDTYTFTAYPTPWNAPWPAGWPKWTINGTTTTSPDASGTFGTLSSSIGDFKTAVASCGTSSATINAVVFKVNLWSYADPDDMFPDRYPYPQEFGIGEIATIRTLFQPSGLTPTVTGIRWEPTKAGYEANNSGLLTMAADATSIEISKVTADENINIKIIRGASRKLDEKAIHFLPPSDTIYQPHAPNQALIEDPVTGNIVPRFGFNFDPTQPRLAIPFHIYIKPSGVSFRHLSFLHDGPQMVGMGGDLGMPYPRFGPKVIGFPDSSGNGCLVEGGPEYIFYRPAVAAPGPWKNWPNGSSAGNLAFAYRATTRDGAVLDVPIGVGPFFGWFQGDGYVEVRFMGYTYYNRLDINGVGQIITYSVEDHVETTLE